MIWPELLRKKPLNNYRGSCYLPENSYDFRPTTGVDNFIVNLACQSGLGAAAWLSEKKSLNSVDTAA